MKRLLQNSLLFIYRAVYLTGLLSTQWGRSGFLCAYKFYKHAFEKNVESLKSLIEPSKFVIDVGANVGFFTLKFAQWVSDGGKVVAIEPESKNFLALKDALERANLASRVEFIQAVAAEREGQMLLLVNPFNPADHRISDSGMPTPAVTIDNLMRDRGWPCVSMIKIDVQGAEPRVLEGARQTIAKFLPTLFIEIDDRTLTSAGFTADDVIDPLLNMGYQIFDMSDNTRHKTLTKRIMFKKMNKIGYIDVLFVHKRFAKFRSTVLC